MAITKKPWLSQLPNQLTLGRMAVIPILLILYPFDTYATNVICGFLVIAASLTDFFDGYIARKQNIVTPLGSALDQIADKMLVGTCLLLLAHSRALYTWVAGLLLARDIGIAGLRQVAMELHIKIAVSNLGKWKTTFQDVAIVCLIVNTPLFGWPWREVGMVSVWLALGFSLYSGYQYVSDFLKELNRRPT